LSKSGPDYKTHPNFLLKNTQQSFAFHHAIAAASEDLLPPKKIIIIKQNSITEKNFVPDVI
jgi:hypothetical protein